LSKIGGLDDQEDDMDIDVVSWHDCWQRRGKLIRWLTKSA